MSGRSGTPGAGEVGAGAGGGNGDHTPGVPVEGKFPTQLRARGGCMPAGQKLDGTAPAEPEPWDPSGCGDLAAGPGAARHGWGLRVKGGISLTYH